MSEDKINPPIFILNFESLQRPLDLRPGAINYVGEIPAPKYVEEIDWFVWHSTSDLDQWTVRG